MISEPTPPPILRVRVAELEMRCQALSRAIEQQRALTGEVEHRAKNALALAGALLRFQASGSSDPNIREALQTASRRLAALSQVHAALYATEDHQQVAMRAYLEQLADSLATPDGRVVIEARAEDVRCSPRTAQPVGLLANEVVTNALKHAFEGGPGRVIMRLTRASEGKLRLSIEDDGKGLPPQVVQGLGFRIIRLLARQIDGDVAIEPVSPKGLRAVVTFPAACNNAKLDPKAEM